MNPILMDVTVNDRQAEIHRLAAKGKVFNEDLACKSNEIPNHQAFVLALTGALAVFVVWVIVVL